MQTVFFNRNPCAIPRKYLTSQRYYFQAPVILFFEFSSSIISRFLKVTTKTNTWHAQITTVKGSRCIW